MLLRLLLQGTLKQFNATFLTHAKSQINALKILQELRTPHGTKKGRKTFAPQARHRGHRSRSISFILSPQPSPFWFHVDVVHVVFFVRNCANVKCELLISFCIHASSASRDLPSFRWPPSAQVTSLAVVTGSLSTHLLCNLRELSRPRSPTTDVTTSKVSPSVRADNTMKSCPSISVDVLHHVQAQRTQPLLL